MGELGEHQEKTGSRLKKVERCDVLFFSTLFFANGSLLQATRRRELKIDLKDIQLHDISFATNNGGQAWLGAAQIAMHKFFDVCACLSMQMDHKEVSLEWDGLQRDDLLLANHLSASDRAEIKGEKKVSQEPSDNVF